MTYREWIDRILDLLKVTPEEPEPVQEVPLDNTKSIVEKASAIIRQHYGVDRHRAAGTCVDVLHALVEISQKENSTRFTGYTQNDIGRYCGWSGSTVGTYTRKMVELGLIQTQKMPHKRNGQFSSNGYWISFLEATNIRYFKPEAENVAGFLVKYG